VSIFLFRLFLSSSLVSILRFVDACLVLIIFVPRPNRAHRITCQRYDVALAERCGAPFASSLGVLIKDLP
jgi:hypothetical protein